MEEVFYAKSCCVNGHKPTVSEHLEAVSCCATRYGKEIGMEEEARLAGLLHDFGKYSDSFQEIIRGENKKKRIDHAMCGTAWIYYNLRNKRYNRYIPIFEAITGHHDGLKNHRKLENRFIDNVEGETISVNQNKIPALQGKDEYRNAFSEFKKFFQLDLKHVSGIDANTNGIAELEIMLYTRMLFSCLVDADYSVSAQDNNPNYFLETEKTELETENILKDLYCYVEDIKRKSTADKILNGMRTQIFEKCGNIGEQREGIFTLTAPTGLGKTLAMLHFALRHCQKYGKKRIIIVLPYLTLAEQNADTYKRIISDILIDHSQSDLKDEQREFAAKWRYPFIITTSVKFFETLFAQKPTDCRKIHNIANSVVLFDEVQSLPPELIGCTLHSVKELCERYHTTMVFSSATQPEFSVIPYLKKIGWNPIEILPDYKKYYQELRRTYVEWRLNKKISLEDLSFEVSRLKSVCVIVNLRKHARTLYELLKQRMPLEEIFFLTTDMCPLHRSHIVKEIQNRLINNLPCRVISTQCIEAGIDLDFAQVYRALAPLDSIIQSAGRCNRNGLLEEMGKVIVFELDEDGKQYPNIWYENAAKVVKEILTEYDIDIHDSEHIKRYYQRVLSKNKDKEALIEAIKNHSYEDVDKEYRLIEDYGYKIIVPYDKTSRMLIKKLREEGISSKLLHEIAPYMVTSSISYNADIEDYAERIYYKKNFKGDKEKSEWFVLRDESLYRDDMGLQFPEKFVFNSFW